MSCCAMLSSVSQEKLGRGINVVIVDSHTKSVISMERFDTYEFSKNQLLFVFLLPFELEFGSMFCYMFTFCYATH